MIVVVQEVQICEHKSTELVVEYWLRLHYLRAFALVLCCTAPVEPCHQTPQKSSRDNSKDGMLSLSFDMVTQNKITTECCRSGVEQRTIPFFMILETTD